MDDERRTVLFSRRATLQSIENAEQQVFMPGSSLLMSIVLSMESDAAYLATHGCISTVKVNMLYATDKLAGIYKASQLKDFSNYSDKFKTGIAFFADLTEDGGIPALKKEYENCVGSVDFFYIPLTLIHGLDPIRNPRHSNGILVSKSKGEYFRIEPEYSPEDQNRVDTPKIYEGIERMLNEIGAINFTRRELNTVCPQSIVKDVNCLFWTAYITREIVRNMYKNQDPNTTITKISGLGKDVLNTEIETFKRDVWKATLKFLETAKIQWKEYDAEMESRRPGVPAVGIPPRVVGGMYWPEKYFKGLTRKQNVQRKRSATRRTKLSFKDPKAYVPFKSDKGVKTRKSSYTERFHRKYPDAKSLSEIAKVTGISKSILQTVYDRGMAAWRTGHRPGASQQAWGMARVYSFALKGKTYRTADADLARKV
jgi:hypothetical protein